MPHQVVFRHLPPNTAYTVGVGVRRESKPQ